MLSQALAARLTNFATQIKTQQAQQTPSQVSSSSSADAGGLDESVVEEVLRAALQPELDRLVQVPFGVPLLHEIG